MAALKRNPDQRRYIWLPPGWRALPRHPRPTDWRMSLLKGYLDFKIRDCLFAASTLAARL